MRARKQGTAVIVKEIAIAGETLHQFAHNNGPLPPQKLTELASYLFGGAVTPDIEKDLLRTTDATPLLWMSAYPPPIDTSKLPKQDTNTWAETGEARAVPQTRPGWA